MAASRNTDGIKANKKTNLEDIFNKSKKLFAKEKVYIHCAGTGIAVVTACGGAFGDCGQVTVLIWCPHCQRVSVKSNLVEIIPCIIVGGLDVGLLRPGIPRSLVDVDCSRAPRSFVVYCPVKE